MPTTYKPVSGIVPQYSNDSNELASDYYLKFYQANTTTPIVMSTDAVGAATFTKCKLNPDGLPVSNPIDNDSVFIPHVAEAYRLVVYRNETDADNDTTASAFLNVPSVSPMLSESNAVDYLKTANDLSDLDSASTARGNLGLGTAATKDTGTAAGQVPLNSDLPAFGTAATKDTGTAAGDVPLAEDVILETEKVSSSTDTTAGKVLLVGAGHQQLDATLWRSGNLDQETAGGIGTLRLMENNSGGTILNGATIAGSSLRYAYASVGGVVTPLGSATGTWKNVVNNVNDTTGGVFTYFVRIA